MNQKICSTCGFWAPVDQANTTSPSGECRKLPPRLGDQPYPVTAAKDWCGAWKGGR
jgi:hypothetical protein